VEHGGVVRARPRELVAQQAGEQVVVAVPLALGVEREDEQPVALEPLQAGRRPAPAGDVVTQRPAQAIEDRGLEQEVAHLGRLAVEHLVAEVVHDGPVVSGERRYEVVAVGPAGQRQRRELQAGRPALGPRVQAGDIVGLEPERERLVEQRRRLGVGEA